MEVQEMIYVFNFHSQDVHLGILKCWLTQENFEVEYKWQWRNATPWQPPLHRPSHQAIPVTEWHRDTGKSWNLSAERTLSGAKSEMQDASRNGLHCFICSQETWSILPVSLLLVHTLCPEHPRLWKSSSLTGELKWTGLNLSKESLLPYR